MAAIKSFTDLSQSKTLSTILPLESADMNWNELPPIGCYARTFPYKKDNGATEGILPCWSFAALLNYLRDIDLFPDINVDEDSVTMSIDYFEDEDARLLIPIHNVTIKAETFVDACYEMIIKLNKLKML